MLSTTGPLIIGSRNDPASLNIVQNLIRHHNFTPTTLPNTTSPIYTTRDISLVTVEKEGVYFQPQDLPLKPTSIIFASKHRSSTNTPALTVHATGNLTREALYGGNPEELSLVEPFRLREALTTLVRESGNLHLQIDATMEATHHGPTNLHVPVCFVEIGSSPEQWTNPMLGHVAANAIMAAAAETNTRRTNVVGFGGTHYPDKLTRVCAEGDYQVGHIVSRHALNAKVSSRTIQDTFHKTLGVCKTALVDWKGLKGEQRRVLLEQLSAWDIEVVRC